MQFLTLLAIKKPRKKKSQTITWSVWKIDSDAQYWELWINTHTAAPPDQNQPTTWNHYRIIKCNIPIDGKDQQIINTAFLIVWDLFFIFFPHLQQLWLQFLLPDFFWRAQKNLFPPDVLTWEPWSSNLFVALHTHTHTQTRQNRNNPPETA